MELNKITKNHFLKCFEDRKKPWRKFIISDDSFKIQNPLNFVADDLVDTKEGRQGVQMKKIPSPKGFPIVGTLPFVLWAGGASKLHRYVDRRHKDLGPIYREKLGPVTGVFIGDGNYMRKIFGAEGKYPKHIIPESWLTYNKLYGCKRGLLFMNGTEWWTTRKLLNNVMLKVTEDEFYEESNIAGEMLLQEWKNGGQILNLEKRLYRWSLEVIVAVLMGCENFKEYSEPLSPLIDRLSNTLHKIFVESATLSLLPVTVAIKFKLPAWKRFVHGVTLALEDGRKVTEKIVEIEKLKPGRETVIGKLLQAGIKLEDLTRIVTDLILAAGDTTTHTTQWFLHLLSMDLSSQNKIFDQMNEFPEAKAHQSALLKGALKETLRLRPVAPFITRYLPEDFILDGYQIKAEELILMSMYTSGKDNQCFPDPDSFLPQRWQRTDKGYEKVVNPNASLPFAMGLRSCVGRKIAETQILVTVSKILKKFVIKSKHTKRINITLKLISVPEEPIKIILEPRNSFSK